MGEKTSMYIFIPSWYSNERSWFSIEKEWFRDEKQYEFDDTVNQVRLFRDAEEETRILLLSYAPAFQHFLHRQNLSSVPVDAVFDVMQSIHTSMPGLLSARNLAWPAHAAWFYTPYATYVYVEEKLYARVDYGEDGNFLFVSYYQEGLEVRKDFYDDRGFLSSSVLLNRSIPLKRIFYDAEGHRQFVENRISGIVTIEDGAGYTFQKKRYESLTEMIEEVTYRYFHEERAKSATVVMATNAWHDELVLEALAEQPLVLSYYGDRFYLDDEEDIKQDTKRASMIITDTEKTARRIRDIIGDTVRVHDISPYDTRLSLGMSQQISALKVLMPIDHFQEEYLRKALDQVLFYMKKNRDVELHLVTRTSDPHRLETVRNALETLFTQLGYPGKIALEASEEESDPEAIYPSATRPRIFLRQYMSELELIQMLKDIRLILDLRDQPNLYLQIAGISAGIPQVNNRYTRYVEHLKNGYIVQNIDHVTEGLAYYLTGLKHWNEALIYCMDKIHGNQGEVLVKKWKEWMEGGESA